MMSRLLLSFRRITSSGDYIGEIDGLRFIAILAVYTYHLFGDVLKHSPDSYKATFENSFFYLLALNLRFGVELFFVISGFVLALPFAASYLKGAIPVNLRIYFMRRLTRLEPPYIVALLLFFALKIVAGRGSFTQLLPHLGASLAYLHNAIFQEPSVISIVAWSLEVEVQFYLLAPLFALVFRIRAVWSRRLVLAAACLAFSVVEYLGSDTSLVGLSLLGNLEYFLVGFLLADLFVSSNRIRRHDWHWDLVVATTVSTLAVVLVGMGQARNLLIPWLVLILYLGVFHSVYANRIVTNVWLTTIGGMCYSIYLLHNYAVSALGNYTEGIWASQPVLVRLLLQFIVITPFVLAVSVLFYAAVERPCMRPNWPQRLGVWIAQFRKSSPGVVSISQTAAAD
jgi:peptidoglycan/LPS O-acetylase OafA/YrhL